MGSSLPLVSFVIQGLISEIRGVEFLLILCNNTNFVRHTVNQKILPSFPCSLYALFGFSSSSINLSTLTYTHHHTYCSQTAMGRGGRISPNLHLSQHSRQQTVSKTFTDEQQCQRRNAVSGSTPIRAKAGRQNRGKGHLRVTPPSAIHSFIHSFIHSLFRPSIHSILQSFVYSLVHSIFSYEFIRLIIAKTVEKGDIGSMEQKRIMGVRHVPALVSRGAVSACSVRPPIHSFSPPLPCLHVR